MKYLIILLIGLISGYFIYPTFNPNKLPPQETTKFQDFIDHEAKAFALLQDADAKLKAAEAMYGKMMILFLADLGLKSNHQFTPAIAKAPEPIKAEVIRDEPKVVVKKSSATLSQTEDKTVPAKERKLTRQEQYDLYRSSPYLESFEGNAKKLLGSFKGTLKHQTPRNRDRVDTVVMNFNLVQSGRNISGDTLVTMTDQHNVEYSRNSGNGGNRALKGSSKDVDTYFVEASPTSYFVISLKNFPQIEGRYYERERFMGTITLQKIESSH